MPFGQHNSNAKPPAPAPARSRYGGITCANTRDPMLSVGVYRLRVESATEGYNPKTGRASYKVTARVIAAEPGEDVTPVGAVVAQVYMPTPAGVSETKRWAMHAAGFGAGLDLVRSGGAKEIDIAGEAEYDTLDESFGFQGAIIEATAGKANGAPSLVGRLVDVVVERGRDVVHPQSGAPTGDFYRNYRWAAVPDEEQTG